MMMKKISIIGIPILVSIALVSMIGCVKETETPTPTEFKVYSKYGFSFEYPRHFPVSETGVLENEANDNSGMVQVGVENAEVQYFQVVWVKTLHFSLEDGLEGAFEGLERDESIAGVEKGELVESTKSGDRMIYQYYTATLATGDKVYGIVADFYHDESQKGFGLMTMSNTISSKQDILRDFQRYLDSFSVTVISPEHNTFSEYGFSFEYPKGMSLTGEGHPLFGGEASATSGLLYGRRDNGDHEILLVSWFEVAEGGPDMLHPGLAGLREDIKQDEMVTGLVIGDIMESELCGHRMIYQTFAYKLYGDQVYEVGATWYCDGTQRLWQLIRIYSEEDVLPLFQKYVDYFVCH